MIPFEKARRLAASAEPLPVRQASLDEAAGCLLAEPVRARQDIPHTATSAMDGWAVAEPLEDDAGPRAGSGPAEARPRWWLRPEGARGPGDLLPELASGEAVGVVTGSPVPPGTVSVLRTEHGRTERGRTEHGRAGPHLLEPAPETGDLEPGRHIRPAGVEAAAGEELVPAGSLLTPARAAATAVTGYDELSVIPRPRAALLLTGGEVVEAGLPGPGEVRDVFGVALPQMLRDVGAEVRTDEVCTAEIRTAEVGGAEAAADGAGRRSVRGKGSVRRMGDDAGALAAAIGEAQAELIVTSGGTARSAADPLRPALEEVGAEILIDSVDMRPGHPAMLARLLGVAGGPVRHVLGLPGNPLAGFAAFAALGVPLIRRLRGVPAAAALRTLEAKAAEELSGARRGTRLLPATVGRGPDGSPAVRAAGHSGPHMMRGLARAEVLAVVPHGGLRAGDPVQCLPVPGAGGEEGGLGWVG